MAEWKLSIKKLAKDFCLSQVKVNRVLKKIEEEYEQKKSEIPMFYKGNQNEYLYDKARREIIKLVCA